MRLAEAIAAEKLNKFGNPVQPSHRCPTQPRKSQTVAKHKQMVINYAGTDADDDNFSASSTGDESDDGDTDIMEISNEEV